MVGDKAGGLSVWELGGSGNPRKLQRAKLPAAVACLAAVPAQPAAASAAQQAPAAAEAEPGGGANCSGEGGAEEGGGAAAGAAGSVAGGGTEDGSASNSGSRSKCSCPYWVAAGCVDGSVHVIDVRRDAVLCTLRRHAGDMHGVRWACVPAGGGSGWQYLLVSSAADRCMHIYSFSVGASDASMGSADGADGTGAASAPAAAEPAPTVTQPAATVEGGALEAAAASPPRPSAAAAAAAGAEAGGAGQPIASSQQQGSSSSSTSSHSLVQPVALCTLRLPAPQGGLSESQKGRVWLAAAWLPACCGASSEEGGLDHIWLVSTGYGGAPVWSYRCSFIPHFTRCSCLGQCLYQFFCDCDSQGMDTCASPSDTVLTTFAAAGGLLGWQVPLTPGATLPAPVRLNPSGGHSRTVFSLHAALAEQPLAAPPAAVPASAEAGGAAAVAEGSSSAGGQEGLAPAEGPPAASAAADGQPSEVPPPPPPGDPPGSCPMALAEEQEAEDQSRRRYSRGKLLQLAAGAGSPPPELPPDLAAPSAAGATAQALSSPGPAGATAVEQPAATTGEGVSRPPGQGQEEGEGPQGLVPAVGACPGVWLFTTGMDRAVLEWSLPCPEAAGKEAWRLAKVGGQQAAVLACQRSPCLRPAAPALYWVEQCGVCWLKSLWADPLPVLLQVAWSLLGLGGHAYSLSLSLPAPPMLAVGCGDNSVRALPLPDTAAPVPAPAGPTPEGPAEAATEAAAAGGVEGTAAADEATSAVMGVGDGEAAAGGLERSQSESSAGAAPAAVALGSESGPGPAPAEPPAPALQPLPPLQQVLAWQGITGKVTAVAWHPTVPGLLAFGCHDGAVGLLRPGTANSPYRVLPVRHKVGSEGIMGLGH